jgi:hypothetical protein
MKSLNKSLATLMQMSLYELRSIRRMGSLFSELEAGMNHFNILHDCNSWVRVPFPALQSWSDTEDKKETVTIIAWGLCSGGIIV